MNCKTILIGILTAAMGSVAVAQTSNSRWVGVWQAEMEGQPSVTLTLSEDTGDLGGTIVLARLMRDQGQTRVVAAVPHALLQLHAEGNNLSFQVKRRDKDPAKFALTLEPDGTAQIHCINCGSPENDPQISLVRDPKSVGPAS
jgi:hypothetical protein